MHLTFPITLLVLIEVFVAADVVASPLTKPILDSQLAFAERDGMVVVEAEDFFEQAKTGSRAFYRTSKHDRPIVSPDGDAAHYEDASGGVYLEILPDTRRSHSDKLIVGENFSREPGKQAVLSYRVAITQPGRYYVWVRAFSTGTEDNGLHVGIDKQWPSSGRRMQWTARHRWDWGSKQRTKEVHAGVPGLIYLDIDQPGVHIVSFSMREDGFEFDKWLMTTNAAMPTPIGEGPPASTTNR